MKTLSYAALVGTALALTVGCDTAPIDTTCDTFDTGCDTGTGTEAPLPLLIKDFTWACTNPDNDPDTHDGTWTYYVKTDSWAEGGATLDIKETGSTKGWNESHDLGQLDYDQAGTWDSWGATFDEVSTTAAINNGTTLYRCGYHSSDSLTWMASVYDATNALADCAVQGHNVSVFDGQGPGGANCFGAR